MSAASFPNSPLASAIGGENGAVPAIPWALEEAGAEDVVRVMGDDGTLDPTSDSAVSPSDAVALYEAMRRARLLDEHLARLEHEGRIGFYGGASGEEAATIGGAYATREDDWIFPSDRDFAAALWRGVPLERHLDRVFGCANDSARGRSTSGDEAHRRAHVASMGSPTGAQMTHAAGFAWAAKMKKTGAVALAYFSEQATSSAEFHNAMNFAGVFEAPVVFFCRNGAGSDGSIARQTASATYAAKGIAYGVPSVRCDGSDVFAVIKVTSEAIARAARGGGPTFIEALTHRIPRSSKGGDANAPHAEVADAPGLQDPLVRLRQVLERRGMWSEEKDRELDRAFEMELRAAGEKADAAGPPPLPSMFQGVYADLPWHLQEQERELLSGPRAKKR